MIDNIILILIVIGGVSVAGYFLFWAGIFGMIGLALFGKAVEACDANKHYERQMAKMNDPAEVRRRVAERMGMSQFLKDTGSI